ncbi:MAG: tetratricopeptide repeat protein, partial [Saprospiraceae bacterium]|nr:tetratricopeptide repeat protein [Saprospiraceae bacterium]
GKAYMNSDLDSSYYFLNEAAELADELNYTHGKIVSYRAIGSIAPRVDKYDEAFTRLNKGLRLIDSLSLEPGLKVDFLTNLGVVYYRQGLIGKAIEPYIDAVEICQEHGMDDRRSRLLNNLGIFYRMMDRYEEALVIYDQSYALRKAAGDTMGMANNLYNKAASYANIKEPENAIKSLDQAQALYEAIGSSMDVVTCGVARGAAYGDMQMFEKAREEFEKVIAMPESGSLQNPFKINLYQGLALTYLNAGIPRRAESELKKIRKDIDTEADSEQMARNHELWSEVYSQTGQYGKAYQSLLAFKELRDTLVSEENASLRSEMETKYLTQEKEYEIDLLNTQNELAQVKLKASNQRLIGMGIGLVIFGGLLLWVFSLFRKTKEQNRVITKANQEKEVLLKEIHHRVKNNLQVVSSLLTLQSKYVDDDTALDAINTGKSRVQSMSILHRNLYQNENLKNIKIKPYFEDLVENLVSTYQVGDKDIHINSDVDDIELDVDTVIPMGLITNELISNALKYAFENKERGNINLSINKSNGHLNLSVSDDGKGIPFTEIPRRSKTLGMQLIHSFSKKLKGDVSIDNENGTNISLKFPIKTSSLDDVKTA